MLISAPSMRVCRSALEVSAPRSFPARSTKENLPCTLPLARRRIWKQAWEREELELANVCPEVLWQRRAKERYELLKSPATMAPQSTAVNSLVRGTQVRAFRPRFLPSQDSNSPFSPVPSVFLVSKVVDSVQGDWTDLPGGPEGHGER